MILLLEVQLVNIKSNNGKKEWTFHVKKIYSDAKEKAKCTIPLLGASTVVLKVISIEGKTLQLSLL